MNDAAFRAVRRTRPPRLVPALAGLPVAEYAANLVKKTIVGTGHAEKRQIAAMLKILLPKAEPKSADAADALAVAITHAHHLASSRAMMSVVPPGAAGTTMLTVSLGRQRP